MVDGAHPLLSNRVASAATSCLRARMVAEGASSQGTATAPKVSEKRESGETRSVALNLGAAVKKFCGKTAGAR